jgi:RHS repeat-associated protein
MTSVRASLLLAALAAIACGRSESPAVQEPASPSRDATAPSGITPQVECVIPHGGASYTAFFSYNDDGVTATIPASAQNTFTPLPADRGQPTRFVHGQSAGYPKFAVSFDFNGAATTWTVLGVSATASSASPPCPDTTAPAWPRAAALTVTSSGGTATLSWPAATDTAYVAAYRIYSNGVAVADVPGTSLSAQVAAPAAHDFVFRVEAGDPAGNFSTTGPTAVLDHNPPVITVSGVFDGEVTNAAQVSPAFSATDDLLVSLTATLNGVAFVSGMPVSAEGVHTLKVTANDRGGNKVVSTVQFTLDRTAPAVTIKGATGGQYRPNAANITVTTSDATAVTVTAFVDGAQQAGRAFTVTGDGAHTVLAIAVDAGGNSAQASLSFIIDTIKPAVAIVSPSAGALVTQAQLPVVATVADASPLTTVTAAGVPMTQAADGTWQATVPLAQGANSITVTAIDAAGNRTNASVKVKLDDTPPALSVTSPLEGAKLTALTVPVLGTAADLNTVVVTVAGAPVTLKRDHSFSATVNLATGANAISVVATDAAGNTAQIVRNVRANKTPPTLTLSSPADGLITNQTSVAVSGIARSADAQDSAAVTVNGIAVPVAADGSFSTQVTLSKTSTTVTVLATDGYGLTSSLTRTVQQDLVAPQLRITGVTDGQITSGPALTPVFTATDAHLASVIATLDGAAFASGTAVTGEGDHLLAVTALDTAGNQTAASVRFAIDRTAPHLEVTGVTNGETRSTPATVGWIVTDAHLGTDSATADGAPLQQGGVVSGEGPHRVIVSAVDAAGNRSSVQIDFVIASEPPALLVLSPQDGLFTASPLLEVVADVSASSGIAFVTANGTSMVFSPADGHWHATVALSEGVNHIAVVAANLQGASTTVTVTVVLDTQPPALTVVAPLENALIAARRTTVTGSVHDASPVSLTVAGSASDPAADGGFSVSVPLAAGANTIDVRTVDAAGNVTAIARHVRSNVIPPSVTITSPADGTLTSAANLAVTASAAPADPADTVTVTINTVPAAGNAGVFTATVPLAEGSNFVTVMARDGYGLSTNASITLVRDSTPPQISVSGVADGLISSAASVTPIFTVTDAHPGTSSATLDGSPFVSGTPVTAEGDHVLVISAVDQPGNAASAQIHFTLDRVAPQITFSGVADGARVAHPVTLIFSATDANLTTVTALLDGASFVSGTAVSAEGAHALSVDAFDAAGNHASAHLSFTIDLTPPVIAVVSPAAGSVVAHSPVEVVVSVSEAGPITSVVAGSTQLALAGDGSWHGTVALVEGPNTILVTATDGAGNEGQTSSQVVLDTVPPAITVASPADGARLTSSSVAVSGTVTDATAVRLQLNGAPVTVQPGGNFSQTVALSAGANPLTLLATDAAGNTSTRTITVRFNTTPPQLSVTSPAEGSTVDTSSTALTGTALPADSTDNVSLLVNGASVPVGAGGSFSTTVALLTGANTIHLVATDGYGLSTALDLHVSRTDAGTPDAGNGTPDAGTGTPDAGTGTPDAGGTAGPSIFLDTPVAGSYLSSQAVSVAGHITGGAAPFTVSVNGTQATVSGRSFSATLSPSEGDLDVAATVTDGTGATATAHAPVHIDRTPPLLTVTRPATNPAVVSESPYLLQGTASDVNLSAVTVGGNPVQVIAGAFQAAVPLAQGETDVVITASDLAGNQTSFTQHFSVSSLPPLITVLDPADGSEAATAVITVRVRVTATSAVQEVRIAGALATTSDSLVWAAQVPLLLGDNLIQINATDANGLTGTGQVRVHFRDPATEPLAVQAVSPGPGTDGVSPDSIVSITFNKAFDPTTIAAGFAVTINGSKVAGGYSVSPSSQTASFVPTGALPASARVQIAVGNVVPQTGVGMSGAFDSDFTVRRPLTQVSGVVLDQQHKPLANVLVTLQGQGLTAFTGVDGNWTIFATRGGQSVLQFDGGKLADGRALPSVRHSLYINVEAVTNDSPLVLVPTNAASAQHLDSTQALHATFNGAEPGVVLDTAAGSLAFPDGQSAGFVTATRIPAYASPLSRAHRGMVAAWQLGPPLASFSKPVTLTMPNLNGLPPGKHAPVFGYDPQVNRVLPLGLGTVSADGQSIVAAQLPGVSFEYFGYGALTDAEQTLFANGVPAGFVPAPAQNLLKSKPTPQQYLKLRQKGASLTPAEPRLLVPFLQGQTPWMVLGISEAHAQSFSGFGFDLPDLDPTWTHVSGRVRGPGEDQTQVDVGQPAAAGKTRVTLPFSVPVSFSAARGPDQNGGSNTINASLNAFANGTQPIAAPQGQTWTATGSGAATISGSVPIVFGSNKLVLTGQSTLGVSSTTFIAQLDPTDAGTDQGDLTITKIDDPSQAEPLKDAIIYPGIPVEIGGEEESAITSENGTYFYVGMWWGLDVDYQNFAQFNLPTHGVRLADGHVARVPGVYFGESVPYSWTSLGADGVDIFVDARTIGGNLTFVDRTGAPLPPACDDGAPTQRNGAGEVTLLSAHSVGTTEIHFYREDDLDHEIANLALGAPIGQNGSCSGAGHAHGLYNQLRIGPSDFRRKVQCDALRGSGNTSSDYYKSWCTDDQAKNFLQLKTNDRLVVFAINHDTGYSGITTVTVPPVNQSNPACAGLPPVPVNINGKTEFLPACTQAQLNIPADLKLYPPEIDVKVARRAVEEGVDRKQDPRPDHLVRSGGSATTTDDFFKISTHWRVRKAPNPAPAAFTGTVDEQNCTRFTEPDGGVVYKATADGGACAAAPIQDSDVADAGLPLEVYCSEVPAGGDLSTCLHDDATLVDVPPGIAPIAGRLWSLTGTATGEPLPIVFDVKPGESNSIVSPSVPFKDATGATVVSGNLTVANYFVQVVGKALTPQDPAPPDFTDDPAAQGRPLGAIGLKNVYRAIDGSGIAQQRFDRGREHQFSVIEIGDHSVTASTGDGSRDLTGASNPSASEDDVSYEFLMQLLEPDAGDVSRTPPPGQYELRLGGDVVGETCQLQIQATGATKSLSGTCSGESLMDVLAAEDILYIELYLSGNAENILYRFNFNGITLRQDQLPVGMQTTDQKLVQPEITGPPTVRRPVMSPALGQFFAQPGELKHGLVKLCIDAQCSAGVLKSLQLDWDGSNYTVTPVGGRADLVDMPVTKREGFGVGKAVFYTMPLPNDLLPGAGLRTGQGIFVRYEPTDPPLKPFARVLGMPKGVKHSQAANPPGQELVAGVTLTDGHLALDYVDMKVPDGGSLLRFQRFFNNQNNEIRPLGLGWSHNYEAEILEEKAGRYTAIIGGQSYDFSSCTVERGADGKPTNISACKTDNNHGGLLEVATGGGNYSFAFTRPGDRVRYVFNRLSDNDQLEGRGEGGRRWLVTQMNDGMGLIDVNYLDQSDLPDTVVRQSGKLKLKFLYHAVDGGPGTCGPFTGKVSPKLTRLARDTDFQLLSEVQIQLQAGGTKIDGVVFEHDMDAELCVGTANLRVGNLTGARRKTESPATHWVYQYQAVPDDAPPEDFVLRNELTQATLFAGTFINRQSTYGRSGQSSYDHVDPREVVDSSLNTGQGGVPYSITFGDASHRTVAAPGRGPTAFTLNSFGSWTAAKSATGASSTTAWGTDTDSGPAVPNNNTSASGLGIATDHDPDTLTPTGVTLSGGVSGATSGPAAGTTLVAGSNLDPRWAQPTQLAVAGAASNIQRTFDQTGHVTDVKIGGFQTFHEEHGPDGSPTSAIMPTGATVAYGSPNALGQPTSITVTQGGSANITVGYDALGRVVHRTNDADGSDETMQYDGLDRMTRRTRAGQPTQDEVTEYDDGDESTFVTHKLNGAVISTESISDGLLRQKIWTFSGGQGGETRTYELGTRLSSVVQNISLGTLTRNYAYDDDGHLTGITLNGKTEAQMTIDADGRVKSSTDQDGLITNFSYDTLGRCVGWDYGSGDRRSVELDPISQKVTRETTGSHDISIARDAVGRPITVSSNGAGGGLSVTYQGTDAAGRASQMDTDGLSEAYQYADPLGRITQRKRTTAGGTVTDSWTYRNGAAGGYEVEWTQTGGASDRDVTTQYDSLGRVERRQETVDGQQATTDYLYDILGHLQSVSLPNGGTMHYDMDAQGWLTSATDAEGATTSYSLDALGRRTAQTGPRTGESWTYTWDDFNRPTGRTLSGSPGAAWTIGYDTGGKVTETDPAGIVNVSTYNGNGKLLSLSEGGGLRNTTFAYDGDYETTRTLVEGNSSLTISTAYNDRGRVTQRSENWTGASSYSYSSTVAYSGATSAEVTQRWDNGSRTFNLTLDGLGNVLSRSDGDEAGTWTYDAAGLITTRQLPGRLTERFTYETSGRIKTVQQGGEATTFSFTPSGSTTSRLDPAGRASSWAYDRNERPTSISFAGLSQVLTYGDGEPQPLTVVQDGHTTARTYGTRGELTSVTLPDGLGGFTYDHDADARVTGIHATSGMAETFQYDSLDRVTSRTRGSQMAWHTTWDSAAGTTTDADGNTIVTSFDPRNRPVLQTFQAGTSSVPGLSRLEFHYTDLDQLASARRTGADGTVNTTYLFDNRARVTSITNDDDGSNDVAYGYGELDRPASVATGRGTVAYAYDLFGRVSQAGTTAVTWEAGGERLTSLSGGGIAERRCYDGNGFLSTLVAGPGIGDCGNSPATSRFDYTYDGRGNRLSETRTDHSQVSEHVGFGYDGADRLTSVNYPDGTSAAYALSPSGARRSETRVERLPPLPDGSTPNPPTASRLINYTLDDAERVTGISDSLGNSLGTVTNDNAGRVHALNTNGITRTMRWDAADRLASADVVGPPDATSGNPQFQYSIGYRYDHQGQRIESRSSSSESTQFTWGGGELLAEKHGAINRPYARANEELASVGGERVLNDGVGSVVGRWSGSALTAESRLDAFGNYRSGAPSVGDPSPGFAGQSWDPQLNLSYAQQRWYAPELGRFLSEDPIGVSDGRLFNPNELNGFGYAGSNPTRYVDPDGRFVQAVPAAIAGVFGAGAGCIYGAVHARRHHRFGGCVKGAVVGGVSAAAAVFTFGASLEFTGGLVASAELSGGWSFAATGAGVLLSGGASGFVGGGLGAGGMVALDGGSPQDILAATLHGGWIGFQAGVIAAPFGVLGGGIVRMFGSEALVLAGTVGGALAGDVAAQGFLMATHQQEQFDWLEFGLSAGQVSEPALIPRRLMQTMSESSFRRIARNEDVAVPLFTDREYAFAQTGKGAARALGNAVERVGAADLNQSWFGQLFLKHVGGAGQPDFVGKGLFKGLNFDMTTAKQIPAHDKRWYGEGLVYGLHETPDGFRFKPDSKVTRRIKGVQPWKNQ